MSFKKCLTLVLGIGCSVFGQAPLGSASKIKKKETKALNEIAGKVKGTIVWSSSRSNSSHDLWQMDADGTQKKQLTSGPEVDWFPRISPDGKSVLFTRSKVGWVPETDAKYFEKWDLFTQNLDGTELKKVANNGVWGTWRPDGKSIVFARGGRVFIKSLETNKEEELFDGESNIKRETIVQEPNLSPDGKFLAATLRGTSRETGIWNLSEEEWNTTGGGCQIDWYPSGTRFYRMNPTGNGGSAAPSEVLTFEHENGKMKGEIGFFGPASENKLMDLPGRRSHEYFPKMDQNGKYMVWAATKKGHDHDIYDYELYIWKLGDDHKKAVRLTFHSSNDRWPDLYLENP